MTVPESVLSGVESALEERIGHPVRVRSAAPVGGGCINPSARLLTDDGESWFLKWNDSAHPEMFGAEADGLAALAVPGTLRVPEVLGWGGSCTNADPGWLLMEFIPRGTPTRGYGRILGEGLARLHASASSLAPSEFGWHRDNFIGSLAQENPRSESWAGFWRDRRIDAQLSLARSQGYFHGREGESLDRLVARMEEILSSDGGQSAELLHGDLWSGNYYPDSDGSPVLIDPAVYRGVGEVDLAMMELFGSLPAGFEEGYEEVRPISAAYHSYERDLYQLFYLLVHVNLFGGSYVGGSLAAAGRVLAQIS